MDRLTPAEYRAFKSALTRAKKSGDPRKIIDQCGRALVAFNAKSYPDDWHRWKMAEYDARLKLRYEGVTLPDEGRWE